MASMGGAFPVPGGAPGGRNCGFYSTKTRSGIYKLQIIGRLIEFLGDALILKHVTVLDRTSNPYVFPQLKVNFSSRVQHAPHVASPIQSGVIPPTCLKKKKKNCIKKVKRARHERGTGGGRSPAPQQKQR